MNKSTHFLYLIFMTLCSVSVAQAAPDGLADNELRQKYAWMKSELLSKYKRPFTMLFLGSELENYYFSIAQEYKNASCIKIGSESSLLRKLLKQMKLDNVVFCKKNLSHDEIKLLSDCEHIDITLVSSLDLLASDAPKALAALKAIGDHVIINIKKADAKDRLVEELKKLGAHIVFESSVSELWYLKTHNPELLRGYWSRHRSRTKRVLEILSTFEQKKLIKSERKKDLTIKSEWLRGINLDTFCCLSGSYPTKSMVIAAAMQLWKIPHHDIKIHNMVIEGERVNFIDMPFKPKRFREERQRKKFKEIKKQLESRLS